VTILAASQQPAVLLVESQNSINLYFFHVTVQLVDVRTFALYHHIISMELLSPLVGLPDMILAPVKYATPQDTQGGSARRWGFCWPVAVLTVGFVYVYCEPQNTPVAATDNGRT
jgi:hypothetical protein